MNSFNSNFNEKKEENSNSNNIKINIDELSYQKQLEKKNNFQNEEMKNLKKENKQNQSQMSIM